VQASFNHKLSYQLTHCTNLDIFNGVEFLLEKNIIATKMKEYG